MDGSFVYIFSMSWNSVTAQQCTTKNTIVNALVPVLPRWRLAVQAGDGPLPASAIAYEMWLPHKVIV